MRYTIHENVKKVHTLWSRNDQKDTMNIIIILCEGLKAWINTCPANLSTLGHFRYNQGIQMRLMSSLKHKSDETGLIFIKIHILCSNYDQKNTHFGYFWGRKCKNSRFLPEICLKILKKWKNRKSAPKEVFVLLLSSYDRKIRFRYPKLKD